MTQARSTRRGATDLPCLLVRGIESAVWSHVLQEGSHKIGRSPLCEIRIMQTSISRLHAEITYRDAELRIRDLNSQNGTFVNERRVKEATFAIGDTLRVGTVALEVVAQSESENIINATTAQHELHGFGEGSSFSQLCLQFSLSPAQRPVLRLLLEGLSEKEVAARLYLSRHTVHAHAKNIYRAIGVHSRPELLARYWSQPTKKSLP